MAKTDTLFMTETANKPYPFGAAYTYIAHIEESPPSPGGRATSSVSEGVMHVRVSDQSQCGLYQRTNQIAC